MVRLTKQDLYYGWYIAATGSYQLAWPVVAAGPLLATLHMPSAMPPAGCRDPLAEDDDVRIASAGLSAS
jgi:hypothetical protein